MYLIGWLLCTDNNTASSVIRGGCACIMISHMFGTKIALVFDQLFAKVGSVGPTLPLEATKELHGDVHELCRISSVLPKTLI